ncbi:MAG: 1-acyl-sn-glycerol-3-phosphate acyltransferase [Bacteroidales bacterium]|jgi:1-acyl-sn-glycerol-3-phosphate acyltransferase|nr:1-acyl-sn-glycerol-3-phosphate acyltransferase [Bacteroidales bacterium]
MKKFCLFLLKFLRFKPDMENIPTDDKYVLLFVPHTSMFDFVVGKITLTAMGVNSLFLIKSEAFWWPLGVLLRKLGSVPVDRKHTSKFHLYAADMIRKHNKVALLISPEGMRRRNDKWKRGFLFIAEEADVPIYLGYLDYGTRRVGIGSKFTPTGNHNADMKAVQENYVGMRGLHKGWFNLES